MKPLIVAFLLFFFAGFVYPARDPNIYPDPALTPGVALPGVTEETVCKRGYAGTVRDVSTTTKRLVFQEYHIDYSSHSAYEVDHLISLELGGSNDIKNLWPEPYFPSDTGAHEKDKVENKLHELVCDGLISLAQAQHIIRTDWYRFFRDGTFDRVAD